MLAASRLNLDAAGVMKSAAAACRMPEMIARGRRPLSSARSRTGQRRHGREDRRSFCGVARAQRPSVSYFYLFHLFIFSSSFVHLLQKHLFGVHGGSGGGGGERQTYGIYVKTLI